MKNIILCSLLVIVFITSGCEKTEWATSDIKYVPVYVVSNFTGATTVPYEIDIYKEKSILLEYSTSINLIKLETRNYVDASTDSNVAVTFRAYEKAKTVLGADTLLDRRFELNAIKATNIGTLKVVKYENVDSITNYTVKVTEDFRYN